jgi:hypothetical protein
MMIGMPLGKTVLIYFLIERKGRMCWKSDNRPTSALSSALSYLAPTNKLLFQGETVNEEALIRRK